MKKKYIIGLAVILGALLINNVFGESIFREINYILESDGHTQTITFTDKNTTYEVEFSCVVEGVTANDLIQPPANDTVVPNETVIMDLYSENTTYWSTHDNCGPPTTNTDSVYGSNSIECIRDGTGTATFMLFGDNEVNISDYIPDGNLTMSVKVESPKEYINRIRFECDGWSNRIESTADVVLAAGIWQQVSWDLSTWGAAGNPDYTECQLLIQFKGGNYNDYIRVDNPCLHKEALSEDNPPIEIIEGTAFMIYGDTRTNHDIHRAVVSKMKESYFEFVLHTGDLVNSGSSIEDWEEFQDITAGMVIYPTPGNHDYPLDNYFSIFNITPYYSFDYENIHIISLNNNDPRDYEVGSPQYIWLEQDLNNTNTTWKIVIFHKPPYTSGEHNPDWNTRTILVPLFERYDVDFIFSSHNHDYERTYPIFKDEINESGVVYFVTGGGGAGLRSVGSSWWTAYSESVHHFIKVENNETDILFTVFNIDGDIIDTYNRQQNGS